MKITTIDRNVCRLLREKMQMALASVEAETGLKIRVGNMQFDPSSVSVKVEANLIGENGQVLDRTTDDLKRAHALGLSKWDVGFKFNWQCHTYELTGYNFKTPKQPFLAIRSDGKRYKFPESIIALATGKMTTVQVVPWRDVVGGSE